MLQVVSTAKMSEKHQNALQRFFPEVHFSFYENIEQAKPELGKAEALITYGEDLTDEIIQTCNSLRFIQVISAGLELMPFQAIDQRKIMVANARGIHATPMAEYVMGVLLQITRHTDDLMRNQQAKVWDRTIRVSELSGKCLGVIGAGAIGQGIARRAQAFEMKTLGLNTDGSARPWFNQMVSKDHLDLLLQEADFIVITLPLTPQTRGYIGEQELMKMKKSAFLINIARGSVVDEQALEHALRTNQIAGAVLDVFEQEPLPPTHPFWELPNLIITPHISGRSPLYMTRAMEIFHHNLRVYLSGQGEIINLINPKKGY